MDGDRSEGTDIGGAMPSGLGSWNSGHGGGPVVYFARNTPLLHPRGLQHPELKWSGHRAPTAQPLRLLTAGLQLRCQHVARVPARFRCARVGILFPSPDAGTERHDGATLLLVERGGRFWDVGGDGGRGSSSSVMRTESANRPVCLPFGGHTPVARLGSTASGANNPACTPERRYSSAGSVSRSPGTAAGMPGGYGVSISVAMRPTACAACTCSARPKNASRGVRACSRRSRAAPGTPTTGAGWSSGAASTRSCRAHEYFGGGSVVRRGRDRAEPRGRSAHTPAGLEGRRRTQICQDCPVTRTRPHRARFARNAISGPDRWDLR